MEGEGGEGEDDDKEEREEEEGEECEVDSLEAIGKDEVMDSKGESAIMGVVGMSEVELYDPSDDSAIEDLPIFSSGGDVLSTSIDDVLDGTGVGDSVNVSVASSSGRREREVVERVEDIFKNAEIERGRRDDGCVRIARGMGEEEDDDDEEGERPRSRMSIKSLASSISGGGGVVGGGTGSRSSSPPPYTPNKSPNGRVGSRDFDQSEISAALEATTPGKGGGRLEFTPVQPSSEGASVESCDGNGVQLEPPVRPLPNVELGSGGMAKVVGEAAANNAHFYFETENEDGGDVGEEEGGEEDEV